jgi:hypothetical protein
MGLRPESEDYFAGTTITSGDTPGDFAEQPQPDRLLLEY